MASLLSLALIGCPVAHDVGPQTYADGDAAVEAPVISTSAVGAGKASDGADGGVAWGNSDEQGYTLRARMRVLSYEGAQGLSASGAGGLAALSLQPQGVSVRTREGQLALAHAWSEDHEMHDYTVVAQAHWADLYIDDVFVTRWQLPASDDPTGALRHWVIGQRGGRILVEDAWVRAGGYTFDRTFDGASGFEDSSGDAGPSGGVDVSTEGLTMTTVGRRATRVSWPAVVPPEYIASFAFTVDEYGSEHGFSIEDGDYRALLSFGRAGIWALEPDGLVTLFRFASDAEASLEHQVSFSVRRDLTPRREHAKGQLYVDGVFAGEWALAPSDESPRVAHWVKGARRGKQRVAYTRVRANPRERHSFDATFEDARPGEPARAFMVTNPNDSVTPAPWLVTRSLARGDLAMTSPRRASTSLALLHVFAKDAVFSGRFQVHEHGPDGTLWFNLRRNAEQSRVVARVAVATGQWLLLERDAENSALRVLAAHDGEPLGDEEHTFSFVIGGAAAGFTLDGQMILVTDDVTHDTYGRVGLSVQDVSASFDDLHYEGEGTVHPDVVEGVRLAPGAQGLVPSASTGLLRRADGTLWLTNTQRTCFVSTDGGLSFSYDGLIACGTNLVERESDGLLARLVTKPHPSGDGHLLMVEKSVGGQKCRGDAAAPRNENRCWAPRFQRALFPDAPRGKLMPDKVTQTRAGRFIVVSTEPHGEGIGGLRVYFSDDFERWQRAWTVLDMDTYGIDLEAGKVVELRDGGLKLFMRTDRGALFESASSDGGATWSAPRRTVFRSPRADFNVEQDPVSGDHYMLWQYDDPFDRRALRDDGTWGPVTSRGRARLALAVSHDDTRTWRFLMTLDDWDGHDFRHMNPSLLVHDGIVWVAVARRDYNGSDFQPDVHDLTYFRVDTRTLHDRHAFPGTH